MHTPSAALPIDVDLIFTDVNNSASTMTVRFTDTLLSSGIPWSHTPPPNDPHNAIFPAGNFFPCVTGLTRLICFETGLSGNEIHFFTPATTLIPGPSALLLLASGLTGLSAVACLRRHCGK